MNLPDDIAFVCLWADDLEAQRATFEETLGCTVRHEADGVIVVSGIEGRGTHLVLRRAEGRTAHLAGTTQVGYFVEDLEAWITHLTTVGAELLTAGADLGDGTRLVVIVTPAGQQIALVG